MQPILVVDDDPAIREFVGDFLSDEGYSVLSAENGSVALTVAEQQPPSLVILDLRMPVLDGYGFLAAFCRGSQPPAPVIAISAHSKGVIADGCVKAFLEKPFDIERLLALVEKYLGRG
jgi:CheY-like chemotaxis protein